MTHVLLRVIKLHAGSHGPVVTVRAEHPHTSRAVLFHVAAGAGDPAPTFDALLYYRALDGSEQCSAERNGVADDGSDLKYFSSDRFGWRERHGAVVREYPWYGPKLRRFVREHAEDFYEDAGKRGGQERYTGFLPLALLEAQEILARKRRDEARAVSLEVMRRIADPEWQVPRHRYGSGSEPWSPSDRLDLMREQITAEDKAQEAWDKVHGEYCKLCKLCGQPFWWNLREFRDAEDSAHPELRLVDELEV